MLDELLAVVLVDEAHYAAAQRCAATLLLHESPAHRRGPGERRAATWLGDLWERLCTDLAPSHDTRWARGR